MNHTLGTSIRHEHGNRRTPVALIVDDATPCVNPLWYQRYHLDPRLVSKHAPSIPIRFMRELSTWAADAKVAGAFTVLPFPAGLGRIDQGLRGFDERELREWLAIAREHLAPRFDIHPKALSSTLAVQLSDMSLQDGVSERAWLSGQDEQTLALYLQTAMGILRRAGLPSHGTTKPHDLSVDADLLARATIIAEETINQRSVTHAVIEQDESAPFVPARLLHYDEVKQRAVVGIWAGNQDYLWSTQEFERPESGQDPERLADCYITADGTAGRIVELLRGHGPVVIRTHYQSLFSNGTHLGLETMKVVVKRLAANFGDVTEWVSLSTLASRFLVAEKASFAVESDERAVQVAIDSAFDSDVTTFTVALPWRLESAPVVTFDGVELLSVSNLEQLSAGSFVARGSTVTVSLPVNKDKKHVLKIAA